MGGWDPVQIEREWSIYDCFSSIKALTIKAHLLSSMVPKLGKK